MALIAICPGGDWASERAADWCAQALQELGASPGLVLEKDTATHGDLCQGLARHPGADAWYFGHGGPAAWFACQEQNGYLHLHRYILEEPQADILKGVAVLAVACESALQLGPSSISKGAVAYVGFERSVAWAPIISQTEKAVGACIVAIAKEFARTPRGQAATSLSHILAVAQEHYDYWVELRDEGDVTAASVVGYIDLIRTGLRVFP